MGAVLKPDLGKVVWMAVGFLLLPKVVSMISGR